jgi:citrate lyase subunit beta/citryl-CoA lyase
MVSLVVPGSSERMLAKASALDADEIVIDLEDAVVAERKRDALAAAVAAVDSGPFQAATLAVRVNAPGTPWAHEELIALAATSRTQLSVVVPKVECAGDLAFVDRLLDGAELAAGRGVPLRVQALIETARGIVHLKEIVGASARLEALVLGYADLGASVGRSRAGAARLDGWIAAQDAVLMAARSAGLLAVDGPFLAIDDGDGLLAAANRAAELGFDGKWAIHPTQLGVIKGAFMPSEDEIAHARSVVEALGSALGAGDGALSLDGEMVDEPVRLAALRTLARAGLTAESTQ